MILWLVEPVLYNIKVDGAKKKCVVEGIWNYDDNVMVKLKDIEGEIWHTSLVELMLWNERFKPLVVLYPYIKIWKHYDIPAITISNKIETNVFQMGISLVDPLLGYNI